MALSTLENSTYIHAVSSGSSLELLGSTPDATLLVPTWSWIGRNVPDHVAKLHNRVKKRLQQRILANIG